MFWLALSANAAAAVAVLLTLGFSSSHSLIRPALLPLLLCLGFYTIPLNRDGLPSKLLAGCTSMNTVGTICQYLDFALISRWSFRARGPTSTRGGLRNVVHPPNSKRLTPNASIWKQLKWGLYTLTAWRATATPWQAKNVPPFDKHNPNRTPSRASFLGKKALTLALCLLTVDLLGLAPQDTQGNFVRFSWEKVGFFSRFGSLSTEEVVTRVVVTAVAWTSIHCILQMFYCTLAIATVATGLTGVEEWPPMFGSVRDCYSIRQFWGVFWHQTLRQRISSPSFLVTYSWLGLRQGGITGRYLNIFLSFAVSGLLHVAEEYGAGVALHQSGSMRFFCTQAMGIIFEDAIQAVFKNSRIHNHKLLIRTIGYIWFTAWMVWVSPSWLYPKLQNNEGGKKDQFLPFSILGSVASLVQKFQ